MNLYHRYIDVPFTYENPFIFDEQPKSFINYVDKKYVKVEFTDWLKKFNLKISNIVESFYTSKENKIFVPIHNDMTIEPGVADAVKLNFTWGPKDSTTRWWKIKEGAKFIEVIHDQNQINQSFKEAGIIPDIECDRCYSAHEDDVEMVYEKVIDRPSLLNVGQLHSTHNPNLESDRWTLSFTLLHQDNSYVRFNEALKIFNVLLNE